MKSRIVLLLIFIFTLGCAKSVLRDDRKITPKPVVIADAGVVDTSVVDTCILPRVTDGTGQPTVTQLSIPSTLGLNTDQDLLKAQIATTNGDGIAIKQFVYQIKKTAGITLAYFKLRQDAVNLEASDVSITDAVTGANLYVSHVDSDSQFSYVVIAFRNHTVIVNKGNVFTLQAVIAGVPSDGITFQFIETSFFVSDLDDHGYTGFITNLIYSRPWAISEDVFQVFSQTPDGNKLAKGAFIWALNTKTHRSLTLTTGGTCDWRNDVFFDQAPYQTITF